MIIVIGMIIVSAATAATSASTSTPTPMIVSRGATAEWPMRKDDTHNSRLLGSMIGPKLFCESVGPQLNYFTMVAV